MLFADSFWTHDYELGPMVLFDQLHEGIAENNDFILLFRARMELELLYGTQLTISREIKLAGNRESNDDYVLSIKNLYLKFKESFGRQGDLHLEIAESIKHLVVGPFSAWCQEHEERVDYLRLTILDSLKQYRYLQLQLEKLQKKYFNRCRLLEDFKAHYSEEELKEEAELGNQHDPDASVDSIGEEEIRYQLNDTDYDPQAAKELLSNLLSGVPQSSHKVAILGTYHNVSSGAAINKWIMENLQLNVEKSESFGQDLILNGFLRSIGSMGGKGFINSLQFLYQWKPLAFKTAGLDGDDVPSTKSSQSFLTYFDDVKQAMGVHLVDFKDKTQLPKLIREVKSLDEKYYKSTVELDQERCLFEELMMDHFVFMEKCELDRLKAIKKAVFDFLGCLNNKVLALKSTSEELLLLEETINPISDLKILIENYGTGRFHPQVVLYDNYYDLNVNQTFGVDLATLLRLDRKVVPLVIQAILSHLDQTYPKLANDEERISLWTQPVSLAKVHALRLQLNTTNDIQKISDILNTFDPLIVLNTFKLYLMELPDPVIPYQQYDLIKLIYQNYPPLSDKEDGINIQRINGLQNVLVDLPKCNVATLDALLTHLTRLVYIIGTKNKTLAKDLENRLNKEFGSLILRPKNEAHELSDKHSAQFMCDLFDHKDDIFLELRRKTSAKISSTKKTQRDPIKIRGAPGVPVVPVSAKQAANNSKSRLELRLQRAVTSRKTSSSEGKVLEIPPAKKEKETEDKDNTNGDFTLKRDSPKVRSRSSSPKKSSQRNDALGSPVTSRSPKRVQDDESSGT